ncbi:MAG: tetratricopeptide repeat protein, partial [Myxococcota bacterium]
MNPHPLQALLTEAHTALQEGKFEHARRIIDALRHRGMASDSIATLDAWSKIEELKQVERTVSQTPDDPEAWMSLYKMRWKLHRNVEATDALIAGLERDPTHTKMRNRLISQYHSARAFEAALTQVDIGLSAEPSNLDMLDKRAVLLIWLGRSEAKSAIAKAHELAPKTWCKAYVRYLTIGAIPEAESVAKKASEEHPNDLFPLGAVARLELWRGNTGAVRSVAKDLAAQQPNRAEGHFLMGAVQALNGNQEGEAHLRKALSCGRSPDGWFEPSSAHVFLSELCHAKMSVAESLDWADKAMASSERYSPNAHLARQRIMHQTLQNKSGKVDVRWHEVIQNFEPILHHGPINWTRSLVEYNSMLDCIHTRLGGNRSASPTWVEDGRLQFCPPVDRKAASIRMVQQHIRCHHVDVVLGELMEFVKNHPDDPRAYTYTGEIQLWNGQYADSEINFNHAIGKEHITVWAWIGLGAARALQGHDDEALQIFSDGIRATNFEGPTVFVYRGEVHRKAGRLDMARLDLDKAIHDKPQRLSGWINRVLVDHAMGDDQPARTLGLAIRTTNPSLWWDAAESTGLS